MILLDARRYTTIRFSAKAIKSAPIELNSIAESYNRGIAAMHKRGYGVALQEDEIYVFYEARPEDRCMHHRRVAIAARPAPPCCSRDAARRSKAGAVHECRQRRVALTTRPAVYHSNMQERSSQLVVLANHGFFRRYWSIWDLCTIDGSSYHRKSVSCMKSSPTILHINWRLLKYSISRPFILQFFGN